MATVIEGVVKNGMIRLLGNFRLEENSKVVIVPKMAHPKADILSLAGAWKGYSTKDGRTLDDVKEEIYAARKASQGERY